MKIKELAFVCYAVTDVKRARAFYEGILGLKPGSVWEGETMAFIEYEFGPDTLAIGMGAENFKPGKQGPTAALEVDDIDAYVKKLKENSVKIIMDLHETSMCWMCLFEDPDGNQLMLHKRK